MLSRWHVFERLRSAYFALNDLVTQRNCKFGVVFCFHLLMPIKPSRSPFANAILFMKFNCGDQGENNVWMEHTTLYKANSFSIYRMCGVLGASNR